MRNSGRWVGDGCWSTLVALSAGLQSARDHRHQILPILSRVLLFFTSCLAHAALEFPKLPPHAVYKIDPLPTLSFTSFSRSSFPDSTLLARAHIVNITYGRQCCSKSPLSIPTFTIPASSYARYVP